MISSTLVIRWHESRSPRYNWFIRGLRSDGTYYGEVRSNFDAPRDSDGASGVCTTVTGELTPLEINRIRELAATIRSYPSPDSRGPVVGVLADGPINNPTVLLRCGDADDSSPEIQAFHAILGILRPHMESHYAALT